MWPHDTTALVRDDSQIRQIQVFLDVAGRRRWWLSSVAAMLVVLSVWFVNWIGVQSASPLHQAAINQQLDFPRRAVGNGPLPIIGDTDRGVLTRIDRVERAGDQLLLADPFSTAVWRPATADEADTIGDSAYVEERFGSLPDRQLALTFDDGPHPVNTPELLDVLRDEGVPATFFLIGNNVLQSPDLVRREVSEGHLVASHTLDHTPDFYGQSDAVNREQLTMAERVIDGAADYRTRLWRIPESQADIKPLAVMTGQQLGYLQADFDIDSHDWEYEQRGDKDIPVPPLDGHGHVIVMHDGGGDRSATIAMVRRLIDQARAQGYGFVTLESILPPEYQPQAGIAATASDLAVYGSFWSLRVLPLDLIRALTAVSAVLYVVYNLLYSAAAGSHYRRRRVRPCRPSPRRRKRLVSIIVPAHNEGKTIRDTLDSINASDYGRYEVIVVNDGSKDRTGEYAQAWMDEHPEAPIWILHHQNNKGKAEALNTGLRYALGHVVVTMDGDTLFEPTTVRRLARHFDDPTIGVVGGHVKVLNRRGLLGWWQSLYYLVGICLNRAADSRLGTIAVTPGACTAYLRQALLQAGGFNGYTKAEDADMALIVRGLGYRAIQDNQAVAWTMVPPTLRQLFKQQLRWVFGYMQVLWVHRRLLVQSRETPLAASLWYSLLSICMTVLFTPLLLGSVILNLWHGHWQGPLTVYAIITAVNLMQAGMALHISGESRRHLLLVPFFQLLAEPLRLTVMYTAILSVLIGRGIAYGWNGLVREVIPTAPPMVQDMVSP